MPSEVEALREFRRLASAAVRASERAGERKWMAYAAEVLASVDEQLQKALSETSER